MIVKFVKTTCVLHCAPPQVAQKTFYYHTKNEATEEAVTFFCIIRPYFNTIFFRDRSSFGQYLHVLLGKRPRMNQIKSKIHTQTKKYFFCGFVYSLSIYISLALHTAFMNIF